MKKQGYCSGRLRFNLLFNLIILTLVALPFLNLSHVNIGLLLFLSSWFVVFTIFYLVYSFRLMREHKIQQLQQKQEYVCQFKHIMMTFIYKEPLDLITGTLSNLSKLEHAKEVIVVMGFEQRTPDLQLKQDTINEQYKEKFSQLLFSIHPYNVEGEIPGKCSNSNFAQRYVVDHLTKHDEQFDENQYFITNFDIDTRFQKNYIEVFDKAIKLDQNRYKIVYQPILFYNWGLDKCGIFVRITSIIRNMLMMGALIPFNINVMSVFGFSMKLMIQGKYTHPAYQMDDIICFIRWLIMSKEFIIIKPLYTATLSGPTSGQSSWDEIQEWARQLRRWTIGSAEVFHFFIIKSRKMKFSFMLLGWVLIYILYYCIFLIGQNIFFISYLIASQIYQEDEELYFYLKFIPLAVQYLSFTIIMIMNKSSLYMIKDIGGTESIGILRNILHLILSPLIIFFYGCVAFYALMEVAIRGKQVCKHGASKKEVLQENLNILSF